MSPQLQSRIKRLQRLGQDNEANLLVFKISKETSKDKLSAFKENLQHRIDTSVDKSEKTFLQEVFEAVCVAFTKDVNVICHQQEVKYLKHRDFSILIEADLNHSLNNHKYRHLERKSLLYWGIVRKWYVCALSYLKGSPANVINEPVMMANTEEVKDTPETSLCILNPNTTDKQQPPIIEHNQHIIQTLQSHLAPTNKLPSLSMEAQNQTILKDIIQLSKDADDKNEMVNLEKIIAQLNLKYTGTPLANLLNFMVHHDNHIQLTHLLAQNQRFNQSLLIKQTNVHSQHLNTRH